MSHVLLVQENANLRKRIAELEEQITNIAVALLGIDSAEWSSDRDLGEESLEAVVELQRELAEARERYKVAEKHLSASEAHEHALEKLLTEARERERRLREACEKAATSLDVDATFWIPGLRDNLRNPYARRIFDALRRAATRIREALSSTPAPQPEPPTLDLSPRDQVAVAEAMLNPQPAPQALKDTVARFMEPQAAKPTGTERRKILRDLARAEVADGMYEDMPELEATPATEPGRGAKNV